jgi:hypothetical protein
MATAKKTPAKKAAKKTARPAVPVLKAGADGVYDIPAGVAQVVAGDDQLLGQTIQMGLAMALAVAPAMGPQATMVATMANGLLTTFMAARNRGQDVTTADVDALLERDDILAAQARLLQEQQLALGRT